MDKILILTVEDDAVIHVLIESTLEDAGFKALMAYTGQAALELLQTRGSEIHAVFTDINLGRDNATGWDIAKRARELNPSLPIVYASAALPGEWEANGVPHSIFLAKPYATAQIVTALAQLLNAANPSHT